MPDRSIDLMTEAILERDQPRTTDLFFRMVKREGRSVADALSVVTRAEAPFVQVPSHINVRDGQITLQHVGLERRVLARRVRVEGTAARFERQRDFLRGAALRSLEDEMFEQMRNSHLLACLVN